MEKALGFSLGLFKSQEETKVKNFNDMRIHDYPVIRINYLFSCFFLLVVLGCTYENQQNIVGVKAGRSKFVQKPGSTYQDSIVVNTAAAVFFHPDSIQLEKLKTLLDDQVYKGSMHEFYYMVRNAHMFLQKNRPNLEIVEANQVRYVVFYQKEGSREVVDLDKEQDPVGMLIFDGQQKPLLIDMTNIDTQVPEYFNKSNHPANERVK
jgi:hypothetical protein